MDILIGLTKYLIGRKRFWLLPLVALLVLMGGLLIIAQGSIMAPFIYTLF